MEQKPMVYMVGNTHFDPVWLWTWDEGMASIRATFRSALDRMKEDEAFCYSFSCPPVFQWIEKTDPAMMEEIKQRCTEGRWCMDEAMWLQPDCFSGCGESYVRQCLYGQNYLKNTFGVYSDTAFNDAEGNVSFTEIQYSASDAEISQDGKKHYYKIVETSKNILSNLSLRMKDIE